MKEFVIDRSRWDRGLKFTNERIEMNIDETVHLKHAQDEKMCCLGFFLEACGVPSQNLEDQAGPAEIFNDPTLAVPKEAAWLVEKDGRGNYQDSDDGQELMEINDSESLDEPDREDLIKAHFAKHGIDVKFEGQ